MINELRVGLNIEGKHHDVGQLASSGKKIYFKYNADFLKSNLSLSPIKLPFNDEIHSSETVGFDGLIGVFWDSLPDGWGRLLQDKYLLSKGSKLHDINALDRLALVGTNGSGALEYEPIMPTENLPFANSTLFELYHDVMKLYNHDGDQNLWKIYNLGGSSGGARPKINCGYDVQLDKLVFDEKAIDDKNIKKWIIKFPATNDLEDIAHIEYAYYLMAKECGLSMSKCNLFQAKENVYFFGTERFDHTDNGRLHYVSAAGMMHDNFRLSTLDYGHLMDCAFRLEKSDLAIEKVYRLACFNILMKNKDDHSKNFGFLMSEKGLWRPAPCFDLTFSNSSHGYQSTSVLGVSKDIDEVTLENLGKEFGIQYPRRFIDQVKDTRAKWLQHAKDAGVKKKSMEMIQGVFERKIY